MTTFLHLVTVFHTHQDSKDSKTLWKCIHSLNPSNPSKPHELITTGDHKTTDHKEIANTFNNYFTSCVEKLRHSRAPSNSNFNTLTNYVQMKFLKKRHNKFIIPPVKVSELFAEITKLDVKTSSGSDNIGPKILKLSAPFIASSLTYIFNRMIDTDIYPSVLKNAKVAPIFKSGEKNVASNYRPLSVLPTLSKLIERHVSKHLYKYLTKFDILHPSQSGFRPNHSCQTALINIVF
ncbi:Hypothetical predicted protein [Mytilus galloprovincialis]|uniref:Reverse transcriptase domain-containing protein n=1 Tax=Mytilus galloprovincialis TaxID=29158 RepID=A0A8B6C873_MYTGA|nr:Hypothetical predicted protein [Mytilus galloprovincialis]